MTALLPTLTITTAISATAGDVYVIRDPKQTSLTIQGRFVYGSGGTNATAYVQTSLDDSATWVDIACLQFTTASATKIVNLTSDTAVTTAATPTDGSLTANTVVNGIIGNRIRCKYVTTGTYGGTTTLAVHVAGARFEKYGA